MSDLERAAQWFLAHGWRGEVWTREAVAKQLERLAKGDWR